MNDANRSANGRFLKGGKPPPGAGRPATHPRVKFSGYAETIPANKHFLRVTGKCLSCRQHSGKFSHCETCRKKRAAKARRKQNQLKRAGLCISGDGHKAAKDRVYCHQCLERKSRNASSKS